MSAIHTFMYSKSPDQIGRKSSFTLIVMESVGFFSFLKENSGFSNCIYIKYFAIEADFNHMHEFHQCCSTEYNGNIIRDQISRFSPFGDRYTFKRGIDIQ